jgi:hypothetical protein
MMILMLGQESINNETNWESAKPDEELFDYLSKPDRPGSDHPAGAALRLYDLGARVSGSMRSIPFIWFRRIYKP